MIGLKKKTKGDVLGALDTARAAVVMLKGRRAEIESASVSRDRVEAAIAKALDRLTELGASSFRLGHMVAGNEIQPRTNFSPDEVVGLIIAINRSAVEALINRDLDLLYADGDGIGDTERKSQLARLSDEILAAERAEEMAVRAAEDAGFDILRRADADPRAVLAAML